MKHSKKFLSLALALALVLALAVPALAEEGGTSVPKALSLDDVEFSVAPAGIATIRWFGYGEVVVHTVYVFDTDQPISAKTKNGETLKIVEAAHYYYVPDLLDPRGSDLSYDPAGGYLMSEVEVPASDELTDIFPADLAWTHYHVLSLGTDSFLGADADRYGYVAPKSRIDQLIAAGSTCVEYKPLSAETGTPADPAQPTAPAQPAEAGTHTAKAGDTWGELALNNYGTYAVWPQLMKANGNKAVSVGMTVTLPEKIGSYSLLPAQVLAEGETLYTVKGGDTLGQIALATYGDMSLYKLIYERNKDRLASPAMIYGGQTLVLPVKPAAQQPAETEQPTEQQPVSFAKGDKVTVREGAKTYTGGNLASFVYKNTYTVIAVKGDRVVIGINGVVTAAMNAADLVSAK